MCGGACDGACGGACDGACGGACGGACDGANACFVCPLWTYLANRSLLSLCKGCSKEPHFAHCHLS